MRGVPSIGQKAEVRRTFAQSDFDRFAALSGDDNPIHVSPEFAARTKFGRTVAHGMFLYSAVCSLLGSDLPGPGTVQIAQELMFPSATYAGEEVTVQVQVSEIRPDEMVAELGTLLIRPDGSPGLQGRTLVWLPGAPRPGGPVPGALGLQAGPKGPGPSEAGAEMESFKGMEIGQRAELRRTFANQDLIEYSDLVGDANPVHADTGAARSLGLIGPIVPGGLLGGLFSTLLGTRLPGRGTNYLKQKLAFPSVAYAGQELTAAVEVIRIRSDKQLVNLRTVCTNPAGDVVCQGEALVLVSDVVPAR